MKKLLTVLLVIAMACSSLSFAFAETEGTDLVAPPTTIEGTEGTDPVTTPEGEDASADVVVAPISDANAIKVTFDGVAVAFTEESGSPFIDENNRTQVPFRQTLEAFGATVEWDQENKIAKATKGDIVVRVPIGTDYIITDYDLKDTLEMKNDTVSLIKDNRTYLPIRIVLEAFGAEVSWDAETRTVVVVTTPAAATDGTTTDGTTTDATTTDDTTK